MRPIGGFFYCFSCQPYKETNHACRGSWEQKHFFLPCHFFLFSFHFSSFWPLLCSSLSFNVLPKDEKKLVFILKLVISTCRFVWRLTKSVLMVFTVTSSDWKVKKATFYEILFTLGWRVIKQKSLYKFQPRSMFHSENTAIWTYVFSQCVTPK